MSDHQASGTWHEIEDDGFVGLAGPFLISEGPDGPIFRLPTASKHRNRNDMLQGGALLTFADRAFGTAARAAIEASRTVTVQLNVMFVGGVKIGETVEVRPRVVRTTKRLVFMEGSFHVGDRVIAEITGVWMRITDGDRATGEVKGTGARRYT